MYYSALPLLKLSGILPFGPDDGDLPGPSGDDGSSKPLTLRIPFTFFGSEYSKIVVRIDNIRSNVCVIS